MAFNLQKFNLSDDYATSVEADFTNEFNIDKYTSKIKAKFISSLWTLENYHTDDDSDNKESSKYKVSWDKDEQERCYEIVGWR